MIKTNPGARPDAGCSCSWPTIHDHENHARHPDHSPVQIVSRCRRRRRLPPRSMPVVGTSSSNLQDSNSKEFEAAHAPTPAALSVSACPVAAAASCMHLGSSASPSARRRGPRCGPMVVGGSLLPAVPSYTDHAAMAEEDWDWRRCLIGWFIRRFQLAQ
jgi:hypothetical protein